MRTTVRFDPDVVLLVKAKKKAMPEAQTSAMVNRALRLMLRNEEERA